MTFMELETAFVWECNHCNKQVAFKPHDFFACVAELKARGWTFHLNDDHLGPHVWLLQLQASANRLDGSHLQQTPRGKRLMTSA
jgi:hypothetical protein